jgi:hypothetical protein
MNKVTYKCEKCKKHTKLKNEDYWGKMIICPYCLTYLANNKEMRNPNDFDRSDKLNIFCFN